VQSENRNKEFIRESNAEGGSVDAGVNKDSLTSEGLVKDDGRLLLLVIHGSERGNGTLLWEGKKAGRQNNVLWFAEQKWETNKQQQATTTTKKSSCTNLDTQDLQKLLGGLETHVTAGTLQRKRHT